MKTFLHTIAIVFFLAISITVFSQPKAKTLVLRPGPTDGMDADIRTDFPQTPRGSSPDFIANAWTAQGNYFVQRSLLKFDLTRIPVEAEVTQATLFLYTNLTTGHYQLDSGANASYLYRIAEPWFENQVFWDNQPAVSPQDPLLLPQSTSHTQNYEVNVTTDVQDMVNKPDDNHGWQFRLQTEEKYRCMVFASSDNLNEAWRPELVVQYTDCSAPAAAFAFDFTNTTVNFYDTSVCAHPFAWLWDFGDSTTSSLQNPVHEYNQLGIYQVCLTLTDSCGQDFLCKSVVIVPPMKPSFTTTQNEVNNLKVSFHDESKGPDSWLWDFGDGKSSGEQNPVHDYDHYGEYDVCLTVANSFIQETGCDVLKVKKIDVHENGSSIIFYPNPFTGNGKLCFMLFDDTGLAEITITDFTGRVVLKREFRNVQKNEPVMFNIEALSKGFYLITGAFNTYRKTIKFEVL
ncbi:MAG: PKD domain-containing protein [Bacteroidota bacterium]